MKITMGNKRRLQIDSKTAVQLCELKQERGWSWREVYAHFFSVEDVTAPTDRDVDTLRKHIERKKVKVSCEEMVAPVWDKPEHPAQTQKQVAYTMKDNEVVGIVGDIELVDTDLDPTKVKEVMEKLFDEFNVDPNEYELIKFIPSIKNGDKFRVKAQFAKRKASILDEREVVRRYTEILTQLGTVTRDELIPPDKDNIMVVNLTDVHWNKLPYVCFGDNYLQDFEQVVYQKIHEIIQTSLKFEVARVALTVGHDFFQINDHRGTTRLGTEVEHIVDYWDMFDSGMKILANVIDMFATYYVVDCYYVLANHDADASWHAARELQLMFRGVPHVQVMVDKLPFKYIEWGSSLIELTHKNVRGSKVKTNMSVIAKEAWGRTKYHYTLGGHFHGEFVAKEQGGIVALGSRALSDADEYHVLNGYIANIRGVQAYVFNKDHGQVATFCANL